MSAGSGIEWTEATWNPVVGCTRASAGCDSCYAVSMTNRLERMGQAKYAGLTVVNGQGDRHFNGVVRCVEEDLEIPLGWKKPRRIFVNSMSDLFHKDVPFEFIARVFAVMGLASWHTFQVLTKRPERMAEVTNDPAFRDALEEASNDMSDFADECAQRYGLFSVYGRLSTDWRAQDHTRMPLPNVWLGTSVENQQAAEERIPHLLKVPAAVRFLSCEPLLGEIELQNVCRKLCPQCRGAGEVRNSEDGGYFVGCPCERLVGLHWVIVGGESGPGSRPCNLAWVQSLVEQCKAAGVACFVKQLGSRVRMSSDGGTGESARDVRLPGKGGDMELWPDGLRVREWPQANLQTSSSG